MKKMLLLALVSFGMIGTTAFATTCEPEQKPKLETPVLYAPALSTDVDYPSIVETFVGSEIVMTSEFADQVVQSFIAVSVDVGWDISMLFTEEQLDKCVKVYDLNGNPLNKKYREALRGMYILRSSCGDCDRKQHLVFKE